MRDPLRTPRHGDIVAIGLTRRLVIARVQGWVLFLSVDTDFLRACALEQWRHWAANATVIHRAEEASNV